MAKPTSLEPTTFEQDDPAETPLPEVRRVSHVKAPTSDSAETPVEPSAEASVPDRTSDPLDGPQPDRTRRLPARLLWMLLVAALVVVPTVVAYLVASGQPPVYEARADVVHASSGNAQVDDQVLSTQVAVLQSRGFLTEAGVVGARTFDEVEESLTVERVDGSSVIRLAFRDEDAQAALRTVTALSGAYLDGAVDGVDEQVRAQEMELLSTRLMEATQALTATQDEIAALGSRDNPLVPGQPDPGARGPLDRLRFDRTVLANEVRLLQAELLDLERAALNPAVTPSVAMVGAPYVLEEPVEPTPLRSAAVGALAGGLLAAALWFAWQRKRHAG